MLVLHICAAATIFMFTFIHCSLDHPSSAAHELIPTIVPQKLQTGQHTVDIFLLDKFDK